MIELTINGQTHALDIDPRMPLLWAIRDAIGLTGTKYGCGMSQCGACTVHMDGKAVRSCVTPVSLAQGKQIITIEGLDSTLARAIQDAWQKLDVVQCGFCQSGQIMSAVDLLSNNPQPSDDDIDNAMNGNLCRCNTYVRIRAAIKLAAKALA
ncbi:MAG TPA: (2Fe-2S)-binding protein [Gammaproteobacteria bacterium]